MAERKPDRRQVDRSSRAPDHVPRVVTPRPRPRSLRALIVAAIAGIGITVASSAIGQCDGPADDEEASAGAGPAAPPAATAAPERR